jgi:anti-sigma factor RsiW
MSCRKALEIDLGAYLADPDHPQGAEFRAHYPGCAECSREVATWTRMETLMRAGGAPEETAHLPSELLARFEEDPGALPAGLWQRTDEHLRTCRRCADRLAALREFDFAALEAAAPPARWRALRAMAQRSVRGLLRTGSSSTAEALEELLPWAQPELALQSKEGPGLGTGRAPAGARVPLGLLAAVGGDFVGQVYLIFAGESRIGRAADCEIRIASDALGRVEARLTAEAGRLELTALHEQRPVVVNGTPTSSATLQDGDFVELGGQRLQLRKIDS